jgi:hypothetical protein
MGWPIDLPARESIVAGSGDAACRPAGPAKKTYGKSAECGPIDAGIG